MSSELDMSIRSLMVPEFEAIGVGETVRDAKRRMEASTRRSLIVVDADRPVGVVEWRHISRDTEASSPVGDYMVTAFPVLTPDTSVAQAQGQLADVDIDRIPVVDTDGRLIGEVPRFSLSKFEHTTTAATAVDEAPPQDPLLLDRDFGGVGSGQDPVLTDAYEAQTAGPQIQVGMTVYGESGSKLGEVAEVITETNGRASAFTVRHGLLSKKHKKLPIDGVDRIEGDNVHMAIDSTEFKMLRNEEDA